MTEKNLNEDQEFEKLLRDKMNDLSDSLDCFDAISERVFREEDAEYSDSEFVVTDLENITGKRRFSPLLKVAAAGLAAVIAVLAVPRTAVYRRIMSSVNEHEDSSFSTVVSSVLSATDKESGMEFHVYDLELDEYIRSGVLVTPLYSCPFEDIGRDNVRVRIFVRTFNDILTNKIYAVEYSGEYKESNFIAVAETKADIELSDKQLEDINSDLTSLQLKNGIEMNHGAPICNITDQTNVFFTQYSIFRASEGVYPMANHISYFVDESGKYRYGICSEVVKDGDFSEYNIMQHDLKWERSVYSDGTSALPDQSDQGFIKVDKFDGEGVFLRGIISPYSNLAPESEYEGIQNMVMEPLGYAFDLPVDNSNLSNLLINMSEKDATYFSLSDDTVPKIKLKCSDPELSVTVVEMDIQRVQWATDPSLITDEDNETFSTDKSSFFITDDGKLAEEKGGVSAVMQDAQLNTAGEAGKSRQDDQHLSGLTVNSAKGRVIYGDGRSESDDQ